VDGDSSAGVDLPSQGIRTSDLTGIELRHAIPGRVRLRIPGIKGKPALAREIEKQLAGFPVIRRVEVNPVTGSVLVAYDASDSAAIAELGRLMIPGLDLEGVSDPVAEGSMADVVEVLGRDLNARVQAATGDVDLKFLLPASLFVGGIVRLVASKKLTGPAWYDFLWFAFNTYFTLNRGARSAAAATTPTAGEPEPAVAQLHGMQP
jgi:hypothetical protein